MWRETNADKPVL